MHKDNGFTLVEVIAALAVVAIISTSLFQMFVTSTDVNKQAKIIDMANVIAVGLAETFKNNPDTYLADTKYYRMDGSSLPVVPLGPISTEAIIKVESSVSKANTDLDPATNSKVTYYPEFAGTINLDTDCVVTIDKSYNIKVDNGSTPYVITPDITKIKNSTLPIQVNYPSWAAGALSISLTNESDLDAEFYVFHVKPPVQVVTLTTNLGASSISNVPETDATNEEYVLTLTVSSINQGISTKLFDYQASKYLHSN